MEIFLCGTSCFDELDRQAQLVYQNNLSPQNKYPEISPITYQHNYCWLFQNQSYDLDIASISGTRENPVCHPMATEHTEKLQEQSRCRGASDYVGKHT